MSRSLRYLTGVCLFLSCTLALAGTKTYEGTTSKLALSRALASWGITAEDHVRVRKSVPRYKQAVPGTFTNLSVTGETAAGHRINGIGELIKQGRRRFEVRLSDVKFSR